MEKLSQKELKRFPKYVIANIITAVDNLPNNHPAGSKNIVGTEQTYRLRTGD